MIASDFLGGNLKISETKILLENLEIFKNRKFQNKKNIFCKIQKFAKIENLRTKTKFWKIEKIGENLTFKNFR